MAAAAVDDLVITMPGARCSSRRDSIHRSTNYCDCMRRPPHEAGGRPCGPWTDSDDARSSTRGHVTERSRGAAPLRPGARPRPLRRGAKPATVAASARSP